MNSIQYLCLLQFDGRAANPLVFAFLSNLHGFPISRKVQSTEHSCLDWLPEEEKNANFELLTLNGILVPNHWSALN